MTALAPSPRPSRRPSTTGLATLRRQYAKEGYLLWLGHEAARRCVPDRLKSGLHWNDHAKLAEVNALAPEMERLTSDQLRARSLQFADDIRAGRGLGELIAPIFALVREATRRSLGLFHYDVQI
ncbi:MAG: hypothetical protein KDL87_05660, partial [Verrucomicrobiae bacterium]|nr:hypothetical protein [Verrucomicrobiae bacterium]